jgi:hypothetical protein
MNHDDFERMLRDALAVEPDADRVARLARYYRRQSLANRRRRLWRASAVAAAVLIAASLGLWSGWHALDNDGPGRQLVEKERLPEVEQKQNDNDVHEKQLVNVPPPQAVQPSLSAGRPATAYEQLVFLSRRSSSLLKKSGATAGLSSSATISAGNTAGQASSGTHFPHERLFQQAASPRMAPAAGQGGNVEGLIAKFADEDAATAEQIAAAAGLTVDETERLLVRQLFRADDDQKSELLRLLALCGTARSTPALLRLARRDDFRTAALATVVRIVGIENLARQLDQTADRRVRAALIGRLLVAEAPSGLNAFLALVHDPVTRAEALAAADQVADLPLSRLVERLDDQQRTTRISAALVLGHVNGPKVAQALIERVSRQPDGGVEAWIALLACRGAAAEGFVSFASTRPKLLAHVNHAQAEWLRLVQ